MAHDATRREFLRSIASIAAAAAVPAAGAAGAEGATDAGRMPRRPLGRTGVEVGILGLGADGLVTDSVDREALGRLLEEALDAGITFFDTGHAYGKDGQSEKNLGILMGTRRRSEAFLATKTGSRTADGARRQVEESLRRLRTDRLDLIQVHHVTARDDVAGLGRKGGVLPALRKLQAEKVVRFVGLTGHPRDPQVKEALQLHDWDTFMGFVNPAPFSEPALNEQLPLAASKGAGIIGMKAFGGRPGPLVGSGPGRADAASLLRFAWSQPVAVVLAGVTSVRHLREDIETARTFRPLEAEEAAALAAAIRSAPKEWSR